MRTIYSRSRAAALVVLAAFAWLGWVDRMPVAAMTGPGVMPAQLGLWSGRPLSAVPQDGAQERDTTVLMEYRMGQDAPVWLAAVANFGQGTTTHPPEVCLVGSDFEILERTPTTVFVQGTTFEVMRLVVEQRGERYEAWYWYTVNERVVANYHHQQIRLLADALLGQPASGALVRISTSLQEGSEAARRRLLAFFSAYRSAGSTATLQLARR